MLALLLLPAVVNASLTRQAIPATGVMRAESRTIYLNRDGVTLRPGNNDARANVSSVVTAPTTITSWDIDDDTWHETVDCMREIYSPFDVTITDEDPGDVPHIEAVFGGAPSDVGLPDNVGGVSPFTTDCAVIENSIVFAFTDVLDDDPRTVCEVMAQEVAHSFGLDHELLPSDPMTYLPYLGERTFQDEMADCGELDRRVCGIDGSICRMRQNSYQLLLARLGPAQNTEPERVRRRAATGCGVGAPDGIGLVILVLHLGVRRRPGNRRSRALLQ